MSIKYVSLAVALCVVAGLFAGYHWLHAFPEVRVFDPPAKTAWVPEGASKVGRYDYEVIPEPDAFHTMHVWVNNTDELWTVAAPMVEHAWTAETDLYVAEGPTFDNEGSLYFSPYNPREDVSPVSLDRETGKRRWVVPGRGAGSGAILILNDPDEAGRQLIYHGTYTTAMALRPDGSVVWEAPTGLRLPELRPGSTPTIYRNSDRVMVSDDNGNVIALDDELNELWRIDVGPQVVASVAVASDNDEIYVVTKYDVIKLIDRGDSGEIAWRATLDAYPGFDNFNAFTPTITANGLAASHPESARDDLRRIRARIRQSRNALPRARKNGELSPEIQAAISVGLDAAEANASIAGLARVADALTSVCGLFE